MCPRHISPLQCFFLLFPSSGALPSSSPRFLSAPASPARPRPSTNTFSRSGEQAAWKWEGVNGIWGGDLGNFPKGIVDPAAPACGNAAAAPPPPLQAFPAPQARPERGKRRPKSDPLFAPITAPKTLFNPRFFTPQPSITKRGTRKELETSRRRRRPSPPLPSSVPPPPLQSVGLRSIFSPGQRFSPPPPSQ